MFAIVATPQPDETSFGSESDPISALRQYPLLISGFVLGFAVFGAMFASSRPATFEASAGLVVEDARVSSLFNTRSGDAERYVADQVAILQSPAVADRASALAAAADPPALVSAAQLTENLVIVSRSTTNFIEISFTADDPVTAQRGADALGLAYQEVIGVALAEDARMALDQLDDAIATTLEEIVLLQDQVESTRSGTEARIELDRQVPEIVAELVSVRDQGARIPIIDTTEDDRAVLAVLKARAEQLTAELSARLLVSDVEARLPATAILLRQQRDAGALLTDLTLRRSQIEVDAQLAGNGVAFFAPAAAGRDIGISPRAAIAISVVLGGFVGAGAAYVLSQRRQRVEDRLAPRSILGVPLLVDMPRESSRLPILDWLGIGRRRDWMRDDSGDLPVLDDRTSTRADAFRILAGALQRQILEWRELTESRATAPRGMIVTTLSAVTADASTVVAANVAIAAGQAGLRVIVVDGDVIGQNLTRLMQRKAAVTRFWASAGLQSATELRIGTAGIVDVLRHGAALEDVIVPLDVQDGTTISVLTIGNTSGSPSDILGSQAMADVAHKLAEDYDLVVVSLPAVLGVSYATPVQLSDRTLVVVPHNTDAGNLFELRHRMNIMDVPMMGYAYIGPPERGRDKHVPQDQQQPLPTQEQPDDLTAIKGIGPTLQAILYEHGITTFDHVATSTSARLSQVLEESDPQLAFHDTFEWPARAAQARDGASE